MKSIILIRHAKAQDLHQAITDFQRSLTTKGEKQAALMAQKLKEKDILIDTMISSSANRAFETASIFAEILKYPQNEIEADESFYNYYSTNNFLEYISQINDLNQTIALFGHNPDISNLAYNLSKNFDEAMPKCGVLGLVFDTNSWKKIQARTGKVLFLEYPKKYMVS